LAAAISASATLLSGLIRLKDEGLQIHGVFGGADVAGYGGEISSPFCRRMALFPPTIDCRVPQPSAGTRALDLERMVVGVNYPVFRKR